MGVFSTLIGAKKNMAVVAKLVNAPDCGSGIRGFEPHQSPHYFFYWAIAKRLRQWTLTPSPVVQIYLAQPFF